MSNRFLKIHPADNVWVALTDLKAGESISINNSPLTLLNDVPAKHKLVEKSLQPDDEIIMYGILVGKATQPIPAGAAIGTHNVKHKASSYSSKTKTYTWSPPDVSKHKSKTFMGYHRADGQVGTANYWLMIPLVFCENRNVNVIRQAFEEGLGFSKPDPYKNYVNELVRLYKEGKTDSITSASLQTAQSNGGLRLFKNIDGVKMLLQEGGCGGTRQDANTLCAWLAG